MIPTTTTSIGGAFAQSTAALPHASAGHHVARQLWGLDFPSPTFSLSHCTPFTLPSKGFIAIGGQTISLTTDATFQPECTGNMNSDVFSIADLRDPFYASTIPQTYVIAASTVIAWILVTMLVITPRTAFLGTPNGTPGILSRGRGIITGASGGLSSLTGTGSRPWLQKLATLTAAISLTIATADTFRAAKHQYYMGFMDAQALRDQVLGSLEIRIVRVISDIFLWLAQVQTLIRLFPRHKEKVLIKWIGFALIVLDTIFSCLNSFMVNGDHKRSPRFQDAIPALSYLFELALGLLYCAWVIYYALTKRRYAFYHPKMRNICIIAVLSIVAVSTPVVFFITDVSNPAIAGWGDYVRWVGAGAASVVVWEWVERIEAIERDEKKDDILGREVFDGDEMLDVAPTEEAVWTPGRNLGSRFRRRWDDNDSSGGGGDGSLSTMEQGRARRVGAFRSGKAKGPPTEFTGTSTTDVGHGAGTSGVRFRDLPTSNQQPGRNTNPVLPPPRHNQTPVSRADTTSAASTVYVVRYQPDIPQPVRRDMDLNRNLRNARTKTNVESHSSDHDPEKEAAEAEQGRARGGDQFWHSVPNPFKRKRASPPKEVQQARAAVEVQDHTSPPIHNFSRWDVVNRLGVLAAETGERFRDRAAGRRPEADLPVTVVPAQPRGSGRTWSPAVLESNHERVMTAPAETSHNTSSSDGSTTLINSQSGFGSSHSSQPKERGQAEEPLEIRGTPPRPDQLVPNQDGGAVVVPAPERRSPFARGSVANWSRDDRSVDRSGPP